MKNNKQVSTYDLIPDLIKSSVAQLFLEFYDKVKHGDDDHMKWLSDETLKFIEERVYEKQDI